MILVEVFKQINNIFNFIEHNYEIRDIILKIRAKQYQKDKEVYVNNILTILNIDISNMDFQDKKEALKIAIGSIGLNQHEQFKELWVARYISEEVSWNNLWNKFYEQARGSAISMETFEIVNRAPDKFYNYGEIQLPREKVHEWLENAVYTEFANKEDGSFIAIGFYKDTLIVNTPGSFQSKEALTARKMLLEDEKYQKLLTYIKQNKDITLSGEFIHPDFPIIINYRNKKDIILHTKVKKETGEVSLYSEVQEIAKELGLSSVPIEFNDFSCLNLATKGHFRGTEKEGWVGIIQHIDGRKLMVKLKCEDYCELHSYLKKVQSPRHILKLIVDEKLDDIFAKLDNPSVIEVVSKTANFVSTTLSELTDKSIEEMRSIVDSVDFEAFKEYTKVIKYVEEHKLTLSKFDFSKGDYNQFIKDIEKELKSFSDIINGKNFNELMDNDDIANYSINLSEQLKEILQLRFISKLKDHVNEFLKGNKTNKKHELQLHAKDVLSKLQEKRSGLIEKINEYKKQKSRFQIHIKKMPKNLEKYLKELEEYKFDIDAFIAKIIINQTNNEGFDLKLYQLYKQNHISASEYIQYCLQQEEITIMEKEQIELFARNIDSVYVIDRDLIEYNSLIEKDIEEINDGSKFLIKDVSKEVRKLMYGEEPDNSYEIALKIFNELQVDSEKIKRYFDTSKNVLKQLKASNDLTSHYAKYSLHDACDFDTKESLMRYIAEVLIKDKEKIRYQMLKNDIYKLFIASNNGVIETIE